MVSFSGGGAMIQPRAAIRQVTSDGAITVDEKLTLRSLSTVLARALAQGGEPDEIWVTSVMTEDLVTAEPNEPVIESARDVLDVIVDYMRTSDRLRLVAATTVDRRMGTL
jgi:hypothetical protein